MNKAIKTLSSKGLRLVSFNDGGYIIPTKTYNKLKAELDKNLNEIEHNNYKDEKGIERTITIGGPSPNREKKKSDESKDVDVKKSDESKDVDVKKSDVKSDESKDVDVKKDTSDTHAAKQQSNDSHKTEQKHNDKNIKPITIPKRDFDRGLEVMRFRAEVAKNAKDEYWDLLPSSYKNILGYHKPSE